jgi:hypothetical protein
VGGASRRINFNPLWREVRSNLMEKTLKVSFVVLLALLLAAGAALAGGNPGSGPDKVAAPPAPAAPMVTPQAQPGLKWMFA